MAPSSSWSPAPVLWKVLHRQQFLQQLAVTPLALHCSCKGNRTTHPHTLTSSPAWPTAVWLGGLEFVPRVQSLSSKLWAWGSFMAARDPAGHWGEAEAAMDVGGIGQLGMVLGANPQRSCRWLRKALRLHLLEGREIEGRITMRTPCSLVLAKHPLLATVRNCARRAPGPHSVILALCARTGARQWTAAGCCVWWGDYLPLVNTHKHRWAASKSYLTFSPHTCSCRKA